MIGVKIIFWGVLGFLLPDSYALFYHAKILYAHSHSLCPDLNIHLYYNNTVSAALNQCCVLDVYSSGQQMWLQLLPGV